MKKLFLSLVVVAAFGFASQASAQSTSRKPTTASGVKVQQSARPGSRDLRPAPAAQSGASQRDMTISQGQPAQSAIGKKFGSGKSSGKASSTTTPRSPQGQATIKR